jgi:hypothetical protein
MQSWKRKNNRKLLLLPMHAGSWFYYVTSSSNLFHLALKNFFCQRCLCAFISKLHKVFQVPLISIPLREESVQKVLVPFSIVRENPILKTF